MNNADLLFNKVIENSVFIHGKSTILEKEIIQNRLIDPILSCHPNLTINNESFQQREQKMKVKKKELKIIIKEIDEENIDYLALKGLAMSKYYPKNILRQSNDFDLILKTPQDFWKLHRLFDKKGYEFTYLPMFSENHNSFLGLLKYEKVLENNIKIRIEVNISHFIVAEGVWYVKDLWEQSQFINFNGISLKIPSDENNLIMLILESSGRDEMFVRDFIDYYFIMQATSINFKNIEKKLNNVFLKSVFSKFIAYSNEFNFKKVKRKNSKIARELGIILPNLLKEKSMKKVYHRYLKFLGDNLIEKDILFGIVEKIDANVSTLTRFKQGLFCHFYLIDGEKIGQLKWVKFEKYYLLITPIGAFIATNFAFIEEDDEFKIKEFLRMV
ncbi:nucleotidyltransferase family protein [Solibacillus sp. NPDC093137]|uniref:nucleotidyltransferase family protein n=1 Tax=Solibacillus sp. NPDC093137 TaxID=3390678 RepID=UPI003D02A0B6